MNTALIITTYNRPEYLQKCLKSIEALSEFPEIIIIADDCSTDIKVEQLICDFCCKRDAARMTIPMLIPVNSGIKKVLKESIEFAFKLGAELIINLDGDAIVKPNFITELKRLHAKHYGYIVSGFNSSNKNNDGSLRNPKILESTDYIRKKFANGINMCFNQRQYEENILPALNSEGNWDHNTKGNGFIIAKPSLVQHIGLNSSMGHNNDPDVAADFYELELPDVTLFGIDAHDPAGIKRAAEICTRSVQFGGVQIITERLFSGREAYSHFCIADMAKYIKTSHALIIHPDGFIQNPAAWTNEFLEYDYGGATWWYKDNMNVGNGGFSLRSKKLLDILASLDLTGQNVHPEDNYICRQIRPWLEKEYGIKFMPEELANRFAIEAYNVPSPDNAYAGSFGFHGYHVSGLPTPPASKSNYIKPTAPKPHNTQNRRVK